MSEPSAQPTSAAGRLAEASDRAARSYTGVLVGYALVTVVSMLLIGVAPGALVAAALVWLIATIGVFAFHHRHRWELKQFSSQHAIVSMTCASLGVIALLAGSFYFRGDLAWWVPAGIVTALPALLGAVVVSRAR